ncbi:prepilin-type N-terminal cleavage/methylation domain-containing protein [Acidobacteria bacterium AH-259-D05]|nr:prepilin-type N-terminal cleavage/methylation domain-containing protein [Acidobacteria bacterium AH-259-D05]
MRIEKGISLIETLIAMATLFMIAAIVVPHL